MRQTPAPIFAFALADAKTAPQQNTLQETLVAISINGQPPSASSFLILIDSQEKVLLRRSDLRKLSVIVPDQDNPEDFWPLDNLPSTQYRLDAKTLTLFIETHSNNFRPQHIRAIPQSVSAPQKPPLGGYLNYDISTQHYHNEAILGAQFGLGVFNNGWSGTTDFFNRDLDGNSRFIRQMTTITLDLPEQRNSLRIGDAINRNGSWGRPVRFGGVQWATNFATQPDFITFPLPSLSSAAALPSTAEVFINNVRKFESDVSPGPFSINELPVITGGGEIQMVVQDALGREQHITQSFYASQGLLKPGVEDFSLELGNLRESYGEQSNDYGHWMASATQRKGLTDTLTAEWHGELTSDLQSIGLGATTLLSRFGELNSTIAASNGDLGDGWLFGIGFERKTPNFGFGLQTRITSRDFDQLGRNSEYRLARQQTEAHLGWHNKKLGSFGLGFVHHNNRDEPDNKLFTANYNHPLPANWSMGLSFFQNMEKPRDYAFTLTLTRALGSRRTTGISATRHKNGDDALLFQIQQNLPPGEGMGYRLIAGSEEQDRLEGRLDVQNNTGSYSMEASRIRGVDAYRASATGSVAFFNGGPYLTRKLGDSFAVVDVASYSNVRIYAENQLVAHTNNDGKALVPNLRPYQKNQLRIEQLDIPLNARVDQLAMDVVPYYRSGYNIAFPVEPSHAAELRIVLENGNPVEPGSTVLLVGLPNPSPVALNGKVFLTGLKKNNRIRVIRSNGEQCEFPLLFNPTDDPLPQLGTFVCMAHTTPP